MTTYALRPVGWVRSTLTQLTAAPNQATGAPPARIALEPWSERCWTEISVDDDVFVLTWLDRGDRSEMATHPEGDLEQPLTGVFSTRSESRPNPIGLHRSTVVDRGKDWIEIAAIEVITGTPVIDVKPVITREGDVR
jgi:tRNA-Thr(GGU) m(6)t(6)A37 methyltransferase TsaA